jgi:hypothetical protein
MHSVQNYTHIAISHDGIIAAGHNLMGRFIERKTLYMLCHRVDFGLLQIKWYDFNNL